MQLTLMTATELAAAIRSKEISSTELVDPTWTASMR
jgi:Asp-tRNA(Asn)/Glu-tRNA(Gln) amidotransferase A subunit family amidase